jgi:hypothetical protein
VHECGGDAGKIAAKAVTHATTAALKISHNTYKNKKTKTNQHLHFMQ